MKRHRCALQKRSRRKVRDEYTSYWNNQIVVPVKVNGKTTYKIISVDQPSTEGYFGTLHQMLFPIETARFYTEDTSSRHHTVSDAVTTVANHSGASIEPPCIEGSGEDCGDDAAADSDVDVEQGTEQEFILAEKSSVGLCDNGENIATSTSAISNQSAAFHQSSVQLSLTNKEHNSAVVNFIFTVGYVVCEHSFIFCCI